jgi:hypothetical protein
LLALFACAGMAGDVQDSPRFRLFASSHSTAAAEVLAFQGVKASLPQVVVIGGLEGRMYRCDCGKDIYLWDVAEGTRLWAAAEGLKVKTEAKVLRNPKDGEGLEFGGYRKAVDAGQPVVLTYSLDAASDKGMQASFESQDRVSVVGIGYEDGNPGRYVVALLPEDAGKEKRLERLAAMPGVKPGEKPGTLLIPWEVPTGNVIATFITVERH